MGQNLQLRYCYIWYCIIIWQPQHLLLLWTGLLYVAFNNRFEPNLLSLTLRKANCCHLTPVKGALLRKLHPFWLLARVCNYVCIVIKLRNPSTHFQNILARALACRTLDHNQSSPTRKLDTQLARPDFAETWVPFSLSAQGSQKTILLHAWKSWVMTLIANLSSMFGSMIGNTCAVHRCQSRTRNATVVYVKQTCRFHKIISPLPFKSTYLSDRHKLPSTQKGRG